MPRRHLDGAPLAGDGAYRFAVRSVDPSGPISRPDVRRFTLDREAPSAEPSIVSPGENAFTTASPYFEFEPGAGQQEFGYDCDFDGTRFERCGEGRRTPGTGRTRW
jgi:hypothetical protein